MSTAPLAGPICVNPQIMESLISPVGCSPLLARFMCFIQRLQKVASPPWLFPENAVEYFVSYYDYYQPEAYVPAADVYIEKEAIINEEIDRLRMSATRA